MTRPNPRSEPKRHPAAGAEGAENAEARPRRRSWLLGDALAGVSVALVLVPQSLAYAELAGVPAHLGLVAAALPPIAAAFLASSPFLQTGPTALTAILAYGVLSAQYPPGSPEYVAAAALLALLVGATRVALGLLGMGNLAYFMSRPVLHGFTSAAALLILLSQLPTALGLTPPEPGILAGARWTLGNLGALRPAALGLTVTTLLLVVGGRRLHPLLPGVLLAVLAGIGYTLGFHYQGATVGPVPAALPWPSLALPWGALPQLVGGALVIAGVGFAEPAAIARSYVREQERPWNPDRELVSQGAANLAAGLFGAFPVGGSFSRSSLNKLAGARTRWSGLATGLVVLAFLPWSAVIAPLPKAVLAAIVIAAVANLLQPGELLRLWRYARWQALSAYATFALTLLFAPRIDYAVLLGVAAAVVLHLWRETQLSATCEQRGDTLVLRLSGVLFFGSLHRLTDAAAELLPPPAGCRRLIIDGAGLGRVDLSGNMALDELIDDAEAAGLEVEVRGLEAHMERVLERVRRGS